MGLTIGCGIPADAGYDAWVFKYEDPDNPGPPVFSWRTSPLKPIDDPDWAQQEGIRGEWVKVKFVEVE